MKKQRWRRAGFTAARLRLLLLTLFLVLAIPLAVLSINALQQIKWEALHQQRLLAEELSLRIDATLLELIRREEARAVADYQFVTVAGQSAPGYLQRSPLSDWPPSDAPPGLLGYFQVDGKGRLETPLLPRSGEMTYWGLDDTAIRERSQRIAELYDILSRNQLVQRQQVPVVDTMTSGAAASSAETAAGMADAGDTEVLGAFADVQQNFAQLSAQQRHTSPQKTLGNIDDLQLKKEKPPAVAKGFIAERSDAAAQKQALNPVEERRATRREQAALPAPMPAASMPETPASATSKPASSPVLPTGPVRLFESEVDPLEWVRLDSGHLLFFRKVWRNGERLVQGFVLDENTFYQRMIADTFLRAPLARLSQLVVAYRGAVVHIVEDTPVNRQQRMRLASARDVQGTLLLQQKLSAPLSDLQLIFSMVDLPDGPGGRLISLVSILLSVLLLAVFMLLYRLGMRQLRLAQQQQDFIASVSHELKTPLTSIRMFGEMLREGWVTPAKQKEYFDFICDESERLSRLIANVLQLARMERRELLLNPQPMTLASLADLIRSRLQSQVERGGFTLQFEVPAASTNTRVQVDADAVIQILLNLVDNAVKFSRNAPQKTVVVHIQHDDKQAAFSVRDFGPGIPPSQQQKIFELFYRVGNELTRETQGTGIGLALVKQLAHAMAGRIEVHNAQPGAEFILRLPLLPT